MKRLQSFVFVTTLAASSLVLANSAEIRVTGEIKPGACLPTLSGGGTYDFGTISTRELRYDLNTRFHSDYQALSIVCDAPTRFGLRAQDARASSALPGEIYSFGLGMSGGKPIGNYRLALRGPSIEVDGSKSVNRLFSVDGGASWRLENGLAHTLLTNQMTNTLHSFVPAGETQPVAIQRMSGDLRVSIFIAPLKDLDVGDGIQLDGASTLEVYYL